MRRAEATDTYNAASRLRESFCGIACRQDVETLCIVGWK